MDTVYCLPSRLGLAYSHGHKQSYRSLYYYSCSHIPLIIWPRWIAWIDKCSSNTSIGALQHDVMWSRGRTAGSIIGPRRSFHRHLSPSKPLNLAGKATQHAGYVEISQKAFKDMAQPPLIGPLTLEQESRKCGLQDELNKVALHLSCRHSAAF